MNARARLDHCRASDNSTRVSTAAATGEALLARVDAALGADRARAGRRIIGGSEQETLDRELQLALARSIEEM